MNKVKKLKKIINLVIFRYEFNLIKIIKSKWKYYFYYIKKVKKKWFEYF